MAWKNICKIVGIAMVSVVLGACSQISITPDSISTADMQYIADIRQDTLENEASKKRIYWKADSVRGMMMVIGTYERADGIYCRRILETVNQGFSKKANVLSTWCRTDTESPKWIFYQ